ncbi:hypothetical protein K505DRAFT_265989 [Melanomma pulvis-pyrius CBS 109.77]|uniref:DUF4604 domain-containing protein n=1 Tax=Melanomma pulvis-pyrius CBS 109.77 TaxID=1314802 RepID=A0A6A6XS00_9PLEO|nr:hypothetical protein K505DRAFT_265989 [Melanomma pulvis-pyrius CBS 109.77]
MSFKAKDLHYDAAQPAFLRRMRGEMAGDDSVRHEQPIPRNKRLNKDDEDDAPTYVLEDTNHALSKAEYEALVAGDDPKEEDTTTDGTAARPKGPENGPEKPIRDNIAEARKASKKRKAAKIIGEEQQDDNSTKPGDTKVNKKPKKKAKPVKLSFGDEEG